MSAREIQVGDSVLVNNKHKAIVRYVGGTNFADGVWYGLELERAIGKHEGTVLGVTYFVAPRKHGTFVRRENLSLYDQEVEASVRVQGALRMSIARRRARNELTQRAFNALDADEEARLLRRRQQLMNSALGARLMRERASLAQLEEWEREAAAMPAPSADTYSGPHLSFPLSREGVLGLLDAFREGRILHYKYAMQLICAYRRYAAELPTLVELPMEAGTRLTVCGDTHGQLGDLFSIFSLNGVPSPTNRYLMNGDFVDRGDCSCEIVFTLLAFCMLYPGEPRTSRGAGCLLNRGNHESHNQNVTGGFLSELLDKYSAFTVAGSGGGGGGAAGSGSGSGAAGGSGGGGGGGGGVGDESDAHLDAEHGMRLYDACQAAFDAMPLAHLLTPAPPSGRSSPTAAAAAAAAAAGAASARAGVKSTPAAADATGSVPGTGSGVDSRKVFIVHGGLMQHPGVTLAHVGAVRRQREIPFGFPAFEDKLYEDLMWSDPRPPNGTTPSDRGAGVFWGPDVSERFCATNGVSLVVRSHECVSEGFQLMHDGRVMTVFSASHYCGRGVNKGAFLTFKPNLEHTVRTYVAAPLHETAPAPEPPARIDAASVARYQVATPVESGVLSPSGAMHGLVHPLPLSVSLEDGSERAAWPLPATGAGAMPPRSPSSAAASAAAAAAAAASSGQAEEVRRMIMERVILAKHDLYVAFAALDRAGANDGTVTRAQWAECMRSVLKLELPWVSLAPLLCATDPAAGGRINYSRFLDRYRIALPESHLAWMEGIVERACEKLASACGSLEAAFAHFDTDGSGVIEFEELERGFNRMDIGLSRPQLVELMNAIDSDRDGRIQYAEFAGRFKLLFASKLDAAAGTVGPAVASLRSLTLSGGASSPATVSLRGGSAVDGSLHSGSGRGTPISSGSSSSAPPAKLPAPDAWTRETLRRIGVALLCDDGGGDVKQAFMLFDADRDGLLSSDEFCLGMHKLGLGLTDADVGRLLAFVDANHSGSVSLVEFADAFAAAGVVTAAPPAPPPVAPVATPAAAAAVAARFGLGMGGMGSGSAGASSPRGSAAGKALLPGAASGVIPGAFSPGPAGSSGSGAVSAGGSPPPTRRGESIGSFRLSFGGGSKSAASSATPSPRASPAASPAASGGAGAGSGAGAGPGASGASGEGRPWQQGVIESLVATLFEWRTELAAAFRLFDTDGNGSIDREEFRAGLAALSSLSGASITDMQADELMRALDKDGNGSIDYEEFVSAFKLVDREGAASPVAPHAAASPTRSGSHGRA